MATEASQLVAGLLPAGAVPEAPSTRRRAARAAVAAGCLITGAVVLALATTARTTRPPLGAALASADGKHERSETARAQTASNATTYGVGHPRGKPIDDDTSAPSLAPTVYLDDEAKAVAAEGAAIAANHTGDDDALLGEVAAEGAAIANHSVMDNPNVTGDDALLIASEGESIAGGEALGGDGDIPPAPAPTVGWKLALYKRTHASADARADTAFVAEHFGLAVTTNQTWERADGTGMFANGGDYCATRMAVTTMPSYEVHYFTSRVTPEGPVAISEWVAYWNALHAGFEYGEDGHSGTEHDPRAASSRRDVWDAFMANSQTFYAPDLSPFVRKLRGKGVPMLTVVYNHSKSGYDLGDAPVKPSLAVELYSVSVVVPHSGHLFEVVSEHLDDELKGSMWADWPTSSCGKANHVDQSVAEMRRAWHGAGGEMANDKGFPDLLVVKVAFPVDVDRFKSFVRKTVGDNRKVATSSSERYYIDEDDDEEEDEEDAEDAQEDVEEEDAAGDDDTDDDFTPLLSTEANAPSGATMTGANGSDVCRWASINLGPGNVILRAVEAPSARTGVVDVKMYAGYAETLHAKWTAENVGWDRLLDNHIGFQVSALPLDKFIPKLREQNVSFRAHRHDGDNLGSLWTGGLEGQSVELHGEFDWSVLSEAHTTTMDYCASPAVAGGPDGDSAAIKVVGHGKVGGHSHGSSGNLRAGDSSSTTHTGSSRSGEASGPSADSGDDDDGGASGTLARVARLMRDARDAGEF